MQAVRAGAQPSHLPRFWPRAGSRRERQVWRELGGRKAECGAAWDVPTGAAMGVLRIRASSVPGRTQQTPPFSASPGCHPWATADSPHSPSSSTTPQNVDSWMLRSNVQARAMQAREGTRTCGAQGAVSPACPPLRPCESWAGIAAPRGQATSSSAPSGHTWPWAARGLGPVARCLTQLLPPWPCFAPRPGDRGNGTPELGAGWPSVSATQLGASAPRPLPTRSLQRSCSCPEGMGSRGPVPLGAPPPPTHGPPPRVPRTAPSSALACLVSRCQPEGTPVPRAWPECPVPVLSPPALHRLGRPSQMPPVPRAVLRVTARPTKCRSWCRGSPMTEGPPCSKPFERFPFCK